LEFFAKINNNPKDSKQIFENEPPLTISNDSYMTAPAAHDTKLLFL